MVDVQNGSQPVTQVTRDQIAQADHDKLIELSVVLKTILDGQTRLEQQIKDLIQGQSTALATWEAKSSAAHESHDTRIRKLEDYATQYIPLQQAARIEYEDFKKRVVNLEINQTEMTSGWKAILFFCGTIGGVVSFLWLIVQLVTHTCIVSCR